MARCLGKRKIGTNAASPALADTVASRRTLSAGDGQSGRCACGNVLRCVPPRSGNGRFGSRHVRRLAAGGGGPVPDDVTEALESLNTRLAKDDATGRLSDDGGAEVIYFPGRERQPPRTFGPFKQLCSFDGMLIRVGGKDDTVPVHLQAGHQTHICNADREMARRMAPHLFQGTLRVWGDGRWERESSGRWRLIRFNISEFRLLDDAPISEVVERLRDVEGSGWGQFEDPLAEIVRLRRDPLDD